jgi:hypothetical protein
MSGYTRTMGAPQTGRDSTIPRFHMEAVEDPVASAAQGRPIFFQQERVQFIQPGSTNSPVEIVNESHRQRWPEQYAAFKAGEDWAINGTPLEQWPFLRKVNVYELKALGIFTVEQCADLSDIACQNMGMGGMAIRTAAKAYLSDADAMKIVSQAIADKDASDARAAHAEKRLAELEPMVNQMHMELMALKNAASASDTYIQGVHDPVQQATRAAPAAPPAASSLDALVSRGRPRQKAEAA